jgi:hypothetical protein
MKSKTERRTIEIESCFRLEVATFTKHGVLEGPPGTSGVLYLPGRKNTVLSVVPYELVDPAPGRLGVRLDGVSFSGSDEPAFLKYVVELEVTPCRFGGLRRWFLCPGRASESNCGARCRVLYCPPTEPMFACRGCHGLSYRSQTRRDKVYLDYVRPRNQLKRIRERINHARNDENRRLLEEKAEVLEQRLDEFQTWVREIQWKITFGSPVPAWQRRVVAVFSSLEKGSEEGDLLSYEVGSVFAPDRLLAERA